LVVLQGGVTKERRKEDRDQMGVGGVRERSDDIYEDVAER
jgi:hypothetical protein